METSLLIEPVWNRNVPIIGVVFLCDFMLLIEPVWNRNLSSFSNAAFIVSAFNRTSMESKLLCSVHAKTIGNPLLIEPVWNRNSQGDNKQVRL